MQAVRERADAAVRERTDRRRGRGDPMRFAWIVVGPSALLANLRDDRATARTAAAPGRGRWPHRDDRREAQVEPVVHEILRFAAGHRAQATRAVVDGLLDAGSAGHVIGERSIACDVVIERRGVPAQRAMLCVLVQPRTEPVIEVSERSLRPDQRLRGGEVVRGRDRDAEPTFTAGAELDRRDDPIHACFHGGRQHADDGSDSRPCGRLDRERIPRAWATPSELATCRTMMRAVPTASTP